MSTIKIKSLKLLNFKGIRNLEINDLTDRTNIFGDNGTGKTTVFDAFVWLLFGKNSKDETTFEIKTLDKNNVAIPKIDHEVTAVLWIDGQEIEAKKIYREKWTTPRGTNEPVFSGHVTEHFWNQVPVTAKEYTSKINQIVDEKLFKLLSNPLAFNSLKWQDQRSVLDQLIDNISDQDVAKGNAEFERLLNTIGSNKTMDEYKKQVKATIKNAKDKIQEIPNRIDEVERGKPLPKNWGEIEATITNLNAQAQDLESQISNKLASQQKVIDQKSAIQSKINDFESKEVQIKHDLKIEAQNQYNDLNAGSDMVKSNIDNVNNSINIWTNKVNTLLSELAQVETKAASVESQINETRQQWESRNAETFSISESDCACPTCKREFDSSTIDQKRSELEILFNNQKQSDLTKLREKGLSLTDTKNSLNKEAETLNSSIDSLKKQIADAKQDLNNLEVQLASAASGPIKTADQIHQELIQENAQLAEISQNINSAELEYNNIKQVDISDLKAKKEEISTEISSLNKELDVRDQIDKADQRIKELLDEEKALAQTISDTDRDLFAIETFNKAKIDQMESSINSLFDLVDFKMFDDQINGGVSETCVALIDGVPFSDANTASKINAGIDIINTLSRHYGVNAPIFIDNRESVVNLIDTSSQVINLIVSEQDKALRIEASEFQTSMAV